MKDVHVDTVDLIFNGDRVSIEPMSLEQFLFTMKIEADAVATAVNSQFVAKKNRKDKILKAGDEVLTFKAIVGG